MPAKQILQPSHYPLRERATSICAQCCLKRDTEDEAKDSQRQSVALPQSHLRIPCEAGVQVHHLWFTVRPL